MKKSLIILIIAISLVVMIGCQNKNEEKPKKEKKISTVENKKEKYIKYVQELKKVEESTEDLPFTVEIVYEKIEDEIRYQVIIDNPTTVITNVSALAIHDKQTDDVFPSVGIFDDKVNLIPEEKPSGVILIGYIPYEGDKEDFECDMKVLISYKIEDKTYKGYYLTKK